MQRARSCSRLLWPTEGCHSSVWCLTEGLGSCATTRATPHLICINVYEKELLAVVFACERFHYYTYGRDITVPSDHKPLEAITNKQLNVMQRARSCYRLLWPTEGCHYSVWCLTEGLGSCATARATPHLICINVYEKELLAVVFACESFHYYTYGRDMTVHSGHKPLEAITNKQLDCAPPRLQGLLIRLQWYNVNVVYVPGKQIPLRDTLSLIVAKTEPKLPRYDLEDSVRLHETLTTNDLGEEVGIFEVLHTAVTDARIENVRAAALQHDHSIQILIRTIQSGWPYERRRCPKQIQDFWNIRYELAIVDDESSPLVIKGHRIVIPIEHHEEIIQQIHIGHFGIGKTKQRARDAVYWPRFNTDIESPIARCSICQEHKWAPHKKPMVNRPISKRPFQMVTVDFHSTFDTGLATTGPREPREPPKRNKKTEYVLRQKRQTSSRYLSLRTCTVEKEHGRLTECGRHRESRHTNVVQYSYEGRCRLRTHQSTSQEADTLCWWCASHGCTWSSVILDPEWTATVRDQTSDNTNSVATESTRRSTCGGRSRSAIRVEQSPVAVEIWTDI